MTDADVSKNWPGPALVISLDFELHWGVSERVDSPNHPYTRHLYGARKAVPRLLELFERRGIHATWATVGKLFARGKEDLQDYLPSMRPAYERAAIDTYRFELGPSEVEDPLHFAPSLIRQIQATPGQEIGCHTFSHYYCDEPGQDLAAFEADLRAARNIAERDRVVLRSLVFPRNQVLNEYLAVLPGAWMDVYRGNPPGGMYYLPSPGFRRTAIRGLRLLDSFLNVTGYHTVPWSRIADGELANVAASHFLRPCNRRLAFLEYLRRRRVTAGLKAAAREGAVFHLWWHPHNFGVNLEANIIALEVILDCFEHLRECYGMQSLTMAEAADMAREAEKAQ